MYVAMHVTRSKNSYNIKDNNNFTKRITKEQ